MQISQQTEIVERNSRGTRWFHAAIYLTVLILLATGWWFVIDGRGGALVVRGARGLRTFTLETMRFKREDPQWTARKLSRRTDEFCSAARSYSSKGSPLQAAEERTLR